MRFQGKVAIVTGGARGIGYATAAGFLNEGATVVLCASRQETAEQAAKQLRQATPTAQVEGIWPDLSSFSEVQSAFDAVAERYGRIDILVNNAGVSESTPFSAYTEETFRRVMELNVMGIYHCSRAVCPHMERQGSGCDFEYFLHGQPLWPTQRHRLPPPPSLPSTASPSPWPENWRPREFGSML